MKAIKRGKIFSRERVRLETVIPLKVPFSVQIDVCSSCNLRCSFCFHSDIDAIKRSKVSFGYMKYDLFCKIVDDIKNSWGERKIKKLRLFKIGEPLLNPFICKMVKYAKMANIAECIEITTNGILLDKQMSLDLVEAGLDILNISVNGINEKQYQECCSYSLDFDMFRRNIKYFYDNRKGCKVFIKYSDIGYSEKDKNAFYDTFGNVCDEIFVETISASLWQGTDISRHIPDMQKGTYGQELIQKQVCPFLFTTMVINDKGIAHLCCVDWKTEYILGDLKSESIANIWNGEKLREYRKLHLNKNKDSIDICKNCESLSANTIDNIDDYAEMILKRI